MATVYDIATGQQMPVEDPPETAWEAVTEGEAEAFWRGAAWGMRTAGGIRANAGDPEFAAEAERAVRNAGRSRLEVAR